MSTPHLIDALDLDPIVFKLMQAEDGTPGLSLAEADQAVMLYRSFLKLCQLYPNESIVPTGTIDLVWHAHISDTALYRADCLTLFGGPLDHWPYAGLGGPAEHA